MCPILFRGATRERDMAGAGMWCWLCTIAACLAGARVALAGDAAGSAAPDLKKDLVAHYTFDQDASDASGNGHHAVNHGATRVAEGRFGGAFSFDGQASYLAIPAKATQGLTWFTISLWAKTTQSVARPRTAFWSSPTLVGVTTGGWGSGDFSIMAENGRAAYFHGLRTDGSDMSFFSAAPISDDKWHHVALVNEGPRMLLYVDGRLVSGQALWHAGGGTTDLGELRQTASGASLGAAPVFIGAAHEPPVAHFLYRGLIDDVRLWSRALSPSEVTSLAGQ